MFKGSSGDATYVDNVSLKSYTFKVFRYAVISANHKRRNY